LRDSKGSDDDGFRDNVIISAHVERPGNKGPPLITQSQFLPMPKDINVIDFSEA
jgi:hypothetical protein